MKKTLGTIAFTLFAASSAALGACGDDASGTGGNQTSASSGNPPVGPTLAERIDILATCTPTDLVTLLPWMGPAFDPATGELIEPLPEGHVEAVVNGWAKYDDEAVALRTQHGETTAADVFMRDGLLGFQGVESAECGISISHTLWRDEAAMFAFVAGDAHAAAMAQSAKMHEAAAGAHWTAPMRTVAPTWKEGIDRYVIEMRKELSDD
jgi:heme-degrading monooxygenase HmoA